MATFQDLLREAIAEREQERFERHQATLERRLVQFQELLEEREARRKDPSAPVRDFFEGTRHLLQVTREGVMELASVLKGPSLALEGAAFRSEGTLREEKPTALLLDADFDWVPVNLELDTEEGMLYVQLKYMGEEPPREVPPVSCTLDGRPLDLMVATEGHSGPMDLLHIAGELRLEILVSLESEPLLTLSIEGEAITVALTTDAGGARVA